MSIETRVSFGKTKTTVSIDSFETTIIFKTTKSIPKTLSENNIYLFYLEKALVFIGDQSDLKKHNDIACDSLIEVQTTLDIDSIYLKRLLSNIAIENGITLPTIEEVSVPSNIEKTFSKLTEAISLIIKTMGYSFEKVEKKKAKPAKARHKWTKEVSEKEFYIDTRDSIATVMWIKRNQMLIKKGATMMKEAPLNKDGSVGFSAKMGDKIRSENHDKFSSFVTTEDIILKSVNEVGLFLYFAGTNSWLEMIDKDGKTLNEWTVVE
ncbi:MAG: hypothetical protein RR494_03215 [Vagococcus sp.]|uniref:hypothetical protein n=1 Tax=Vagococcus TaxID=2737 RepID=UPI002FC6B332